MENPVLILNESHVPAAKADYEAVCRIVNVWLTKELRKCGNKRGQR